MPNDDRRSEVHRPSGPEKAAPQLTAGLGRSAPHRERWSRRSPKSSFSRLPAVASVWFCCTTELLHPPPHARLPPARELDPAL